MLTLRGGEALVQDAYERSLQQEGERERVGKAGAHPHGPKGDDLGWLKDRTVLLLGDSIDRYHLRSSPVPRLALPSFLPSLVRKGTC